MRTRIALVAAAALTVTAGTLFAQASVITREMLG